MDRLPNDRMVDDSNLIDVGDVADLLHCFDSRKQRGVRKDQLYQDRYMVTWIILRLEIQLF